MTLEIRCPGCGRSLRIAAEHVGKQIRCPACQQISTAGESAVPLAADAATWHVKTPDGPIYGPIAWSELERWTAEGRIGADCLLGESQGGPWQDAAELLPQLRMKPATPTVALPLAPAYSPSESRAAEAGNPFSPGATLAPGGYTAPHRGGLILLGLIGFAISCPIFSLMAWVMGSHDLYEMQAGRMDKSGEGLTRAGHVLGIILSLLWILLGVLAIVAFVVAAAVASL